MEKVAGRYGEREVNGSRKEGSKEVKKIAKGEGEIGEGETIDG